MVAPIICPNDVSAIPEIMKSPVISIDIETTGLSPWKDKITAIGMSDGRRSASVSVQDTVPEPWRQILADPTKTLTLQNCRFDIEFFILRGCKILAHIVDTLILSYCTDSRRVSHRLEDLVEERFGIRLNKAQKLKKLMQGPTLFQTEDLNQYNADDCLYTYALYPDLYKDLKTDPYMERIFWHVEMPLVPVIMEMEITGVRFNGEKMASLDKKITGRLNKIDGEIRTYASDGVNLNAAAQKADLLFEQLGLDTRKSKMGASGIWSVAKEVLNRMKADHPIIPLLVERSHLSQLLKNFIITLPEHASYDGRLHAKFNAGGSGGSEEDRWAAATSRLRSSDPNLQNQPPEVRDCFEADEGCTLLDFDMNQLEFRMLGVLAEMYLGKSIIADGYRAGLDFHALTSRKFNVIRKIAKIYNFSFAFGRGWRAFMESTNCTEEEAKEVYRAFHKQFPEIRLLYGALCAMLSAEGCVRNVFGRRYDFPGTKGKAPEKIGWDGWVALNYIVQGGSSDLMKLGMIKLWKDRNALAQTNPEWARVKILLQVHDEVISNVPKQLAEEAFLLHERCLTSPEKLSLEFTVEGGAGDNWTLAALDKDRRAKEKEKAA